MPSPPSGSARAGGLPALLLGLLVAAVAAGILAGRVAPVLIGGPLLAGYLVLELPRVRLVGRLMLAAAVLAALADVLLDPDAAGTLDRAARLALFLAAFLASVNILRAAAGRSPAVGRAGAFLAARPARGRFAALSLGSALVGLILLFGALNLMGTLVARGADGTADGVRRPLLAVLRGFSLTVVVSPLGLPFALAQATYPDLAWLPYLPAGLAVAVMLWLLAYLFDCREGAGPATEPRTNPGPVDAAGAILPPAGTAAAIMALVLAVQASFALRLVEAVIVTVPVVGIGWLILLADGPGIVARAALAADAVGRGFASDGNEVAVIASAGLIGSVLAQALPPGLVVSLLTAAAVPPEAVPALVLLLFLVGGQVGLNPMLAFLLAVAAVPDPTALGLPPLLFHVTCLAAWALMAQSSPINVVALTAARASGVDVLRICYRWNGPYVGAAASLLAAAFALAVRLMGE